ncbi:hypothetical protein CHH83_06250 [Bacillus sp. 7586-K]|nr:hypothetical protein CHH83_06250 [Bacillus sp. 7586-K]
MQIESRDLSVLLSKWTQLGSAFLLFLISTAAAWYEGSQILDNPWEWKYSAMFSRMMNGSVEQANDILPIDHVVYAAKFLPLFPLMMFFSGMYIIVLLSSILFRRNGMFTVLLTSLGLLLLCGSSVIANSPTVGLKSFHYCFLLLGLAMLSYVAATKFIKPHFTKFNENMLNGDEK